MRLAPACQPEPYPVCFSEGVPNEIHRKLEKAGEKTAASDIVIGCVELEEQQFAGLEHLESGIR